MSGITFGTPAAANPSANSTFGGGLGNAPTSTTSFSFGGFGMPSSGLGLTLTSTSASNFGGSALAGSNLFSNPATSASTAIGGLGGLSSVSTTTTQAPTTTPLWGGLGGADHRSPIKSGNIPGNKINEIKTIKESVVPAEILATVEEFSKYIKSQKLVRENIARMTARPLFKVEDDLKDLRQQLHDITTIFHKNSIAVEKLKKEVTQELKNVEIAQRTKEISPGLQYENVQPAEFFQRLVEDFERQMTLYRQQFLDAEKFFASINHSSAADPSELMSVFVKLNEGFISLAAKLQVIHESVKNLKENYSQFKKRQYCDTSDFFRKPQNGHSVVTAPPSTGTTTLGPSPFHYGTSISSMAFNSAINQSSLATTAAPQQNPPFQVGFFGQQLPQQQQALQQQQQSSAFGNASSIFGGFGSFNQSGPAASVGTPLQKPGNKRGKNS